VSEGQRYSWRVLSSSMGEHGRHCESLEVRRRQSHLWRRVSQSTKTLIFASPRPPDRRFSGLSGSRRLWAKAQFQLFGVVSRFSFLALFAYKQPSECRELSEKRSCGVDQGTVYHLKHEPSQLPRARRCGRRSPTDFVSGKDKGSARASGDSPRAYRTGTVRPNPHSRARNGGFYRRRRDPSGPL
jgi:hypothetical protein